ncbi:hypothetical protein GCM10020331_023390 [Ectobacillus funiculus]
MLFSSLRKKSICSKLFEEELRAVKEVFLTSKELSTFLTQPNISAEKKKEVIRQAFFFFVFLCTKYAFFLLIDKHREDIIANIADVYFYFSE